MPRKFAKSLKFAFAGIKEVLITQRNMRIHFGIAFVVAACGVYFNIKSVEWMMLTIAIFMVIITETLNTAIEVLVNHVHPDRGDTARIVKDICASAVILACVCAIILGCFVFVPYIRWIRI